MANPEIRNLIEKFTTALEDIIRQEALSSLQAAISGAMGGASPAKRMVGRPAGKTAKAAKTTSVAKKSSGGVVMTNSRVIKAATGKRVRRSPAQLEADVARVVSFVKSNPGSTSEKVRAALSMDKAGWLLAFKKGIESKQLIKKGEC